MLPTRSTTKILLYGLLVIGGLACLAVGIYELRYARVVAMGNQAVADQRFDSREYERAGRFWGARQDTLRFNQGVLAYKARNLRQAAEHFRQASQRTTSTRLRMQAQYNLGMLLLSL